MKIYGFSKKLDLENNLKNMTLSMNLKQFYFLNLDERISDIPKQLTDNKLWLKPKVHQKMEFMGCGTRKVTCLLASTW